jgi:two-component sensor histidine kinase
VPTLTDLARNLTSLSGPELEWLHSLVSDWQLLADLSFADLILWVPSRAPEGALNSGWVAVAQMRPTTGPTSFPDDVVGSKVGPGERPVLDAARVERRIHRESDPDWTSGVPVRAEAIPVTRNGQVIAVIERSTNLNGARTPSRLELTYLAGADDLARMISEGTFPYPGHDTTLVRSPRVGDGMLRLDAAGRVTYASPNAQSAYRRLGLTADLMGTELGSATAQLAATGAPVDESLMLVARGRAPRETEIDVNGTVVQLRSIPLVVGGQRTGALVLVRDVTELRRRERELLTKEATIREIHHRVKNNLQTVAALLRLQARRLSAPEARAALQEAVRRVGSIAIVHETLSHAPEEIVDFDDIADRVAMMAGEVSSPEVRVTPKITGQFGMLPATVATPLAMVLTELLQNALQHGFGSAPRPSGTGSSGWGSSGSDAGMIEVVAERAPELLTVTVTDSGAGLPPGFDLENTTSLGLQIVRTLIEGELDGRISLRPRAGGGTIAVVDLPVRYEPEARLSPGGDPRLRYRAASAAALLRQGMTVRAGEQRLDARAGAQAQRSALQCPTLVLAHAAPDAGVLATVDGPAEALVEYLATTADLLGLFNLEERGAAVSDREEQLWIYLATGGDVAPVHGVHSFSA